MTFREAIIYADALRGPGVEVTAVPIPIPSHENIHYAVTIRHADGTHTHLYRDVDFLRYVNKEVGA